MNIIFYHSCISGLKQYYKILKRKKEKMMKQRFLSITVVLVLMLSLITTAYGAGEPSTITTFNGTIEISNVTRIGDIYSDESFNMAEVDKVLEASNKPIPVEADYELYYADAPVTITLKKTDMYDYGICTYYYYYVDEASEPKANITEYDTFTYDYYNYTGETIAYKAFQGTITLSKPGPYYFYIANNSPISDDCDTGIYIIVGGQTTTAPAAENAIPTTSTVLVNGKSVAFDAYTINGYNYFKLRDLAQAVNNTEKNFEVTWDEAKNAINLISKRPYTPVGGELAKGDGIAKVATPTTSKIYKDGKEISLTAYTINGYNYFKLRDIAKAFDIGVTWDDATNTIGIDTSISYVE